MTAPAEPRLFAVAPDGTRLPVIDITNPAFAVADSPAEIAELGRQALREEEALGPVQWFFVGLMMKLLARRSPLIAAVQAANSSYMSGIHTYVLKLGPDNLVPPYDGEIDRRVAASATVTGMRVRLKQVATLLAEALGERLTAAPGAPVEILEIAGGPSSATLNALLLLEQRGELAGHRVTVTIYDVDEAGPAFARQMLETLRGGPLAGRDIELVHVAGNWSDTAALGRVLDAVPDGTIVAATSEGGLFEYGSDADIAGVMAVLARRVDIVTGSVTRNDALNQKMRRHSAARVIMRGLERFGALVAPAGYRIATSLPCPLSDQVLLRRG